MTCQLSRLLGFSYTSVVDGRVVNCPPTESITVRLHEDDRALIQQCLDDIRQIKEHLGIKENEKL